jgi:hypothetical protein
MNPPHTAKLRSLKEVQKDKVAPASVARFALTTPDWGSKDAVQTAKRNGKPFGKFELKQSQITSQLDQIGMYHNPNMIQLPCKSVNDLPQKVVRTGLDTLFTGQLLNAKPLSGLDKIAFVPEQRIGKFGADLLQRPFAFSSFGNACY